ncbi:MAG: MBL fold metallo-hydrolase, partial [Omnitrophica WOR_2 bacterium]
MSAKPKIPESKHFHLKQLAKNVYAAISSEGGWAISNAGIIDLGDRVVIFDTFMTPYAGADLRQAAEILTGQKVSVVINSHYHNDHIWGNQSFLPDIDIISTTETRRLITTMGIEEYRSYKENASPHLKSLEAEYRLEKDDKKRQQIFRRISYYEAMVKSFPKLEIILPNLTFEKDLELYGQQRKAILKAFHKGHTRSDAILYLPEDKIIFASDLLFVESHPYLPDGNPESWKAILDELSMLDA